MSGIPAMYRERTRTMTVGDVLWGASEETQQLVVECYHASRKTTFGWEQKAQEFQKAAELLAAVNLNCLVPAWQALPSSIQHGVVLVPFWEPYKKVPTSRPMRLRNLRRALEVVLAACPHLGPLKARLEQAHFELGDVSFPGMAGHDWRQSRPDSGLQPGPGRAQ